ncbi:hypothetical protein [Staphylococcus cohnii]|uniref:hypothetical protein n=1 Tax=Staphylococcus cohnii TaxID=29382 RepID=UPI003CE97EC8
MTKAMTVHHTINIILLIILLTLNYFSISNLAVSIILALAIVINTILFIRTNKKQIEKDGMTIDDYKKK